ncbi:putative sulfite oxidase [Acidothermus cellulolyticus 11B]|jgi:hypothetical protein|uniref:Putative sulfite oxidase n=1 Tax=Acidothermus cellulolyticus (strain ATCC 43068 / DSM 8971 / 11B) TaxID=351607 RepID=A0LUN2_ACIC1|nr:DUF3303 family protein [Acidothermus cellulolyticus]ABK53142.1 putative sulfite oxidase [Acidothermus cellulolyticus 11B]MCL6551260.1 sulfite oxidase [Acidothermus cellulolyticus]
MALFVVIHQHAPETCPAQDPAMGSMLLQHLSTENAAGYGVTIRADAVANNKHTFYLIAEAAQQEQIEKFMTPFAQAGSVEILPASTCETVVASGGCAKVG